jgi:hypothetical protein
MSNQEQVFLLESATGRAVQAALAQPLIQKHIDDWRNLWRPFQEQQIKQLREMGAPAPEHAHWTWEKKQGAIEGLLAYTGFAVEYDGVTQGMSVVNVVRTCRLASQVGRPLVYIDFVETAPWNRPSIVGAPKYKGVGSILVGAAVSLSYEEGFQGRVGLHSLRQADHFYRHSCSMTEIGPDPNYHGLRYFEMTPAQAESFASRGKPA